ncbi:hypothetical protein I317_04062 [Kwoniella heveanensis CBS 569]|nr:hypothetical protein I317_04062 [Kwoniella heveanensis CBS 569]
MSRPIGLRRPSRPPPVKHDLSPNDRSQSQESTQQPSIEIRPSSAALVQPFIPPSRAQTEPPAPTSPRKADLAHSSSDRAIGQSSSDGAIGTSFEETGDSGLEWTQQQLEKNQLAQARLAGADAERGEGGNGLEAIREVSEGAITSPEAPNKAVRPTWVSDTPGPSRPSTPVTEGDQLDESAPQEEVGEDGLEATELDDPPSIPSPSTSPQGPTWPLPRTHLPAPPSVPLKVSPRKNLSPMTIFSPRLTNGHLPSSVPGSPSRAAASRTSLGFKKKKKGTAAEIEDSFGQDPIIRVNPLERINGLMRKHSEVQTVQNHGPTLSNGVKHESNADDSMEQSEESEGNANRQRNGLSHLALPNANAPASATTDAPGEADRPSTHATSDGGSVEEDENEAINWDQTIPPVNGLDQPRLAVDRSSPSPSLRVPPELSAENPNPNVPPDSHGIHLSRYPNSGSTSSQPIGDPGALFSSQAFSNDFDDPTQTQQSNLFQPTQMVRRSTSPLQLPSCEAMQPEMELEATQPDTQPNESGGDPGYPDLNDEPKHQAPEVINNRPDNSAMLLPAVSRIPSVASTTTSSRVEVPAHRQLQRRSRADDTSIVSPFAAHSPQMALQAVSEITHIPRLQQRQSEVIRVPEGSSPFKKTSPPRRSSEPPVFQETLQESSSDPPVVGPWFDGPQRKALVTRPSSPPPASHHSTPSQPSSPPQPLFPAQKLSRAPVANPPTLEETATDEPPLPAPLPVKTSPIKQYIGRSKRRRIPDSPSPSSKNDQQDSDMESEPTPQDPEDHTYVPKSNGSKPKAPGASTTVSRAIELAGKKRKRHSSLASSLSAISGSDDDSSSAPEDPADNTYQPSLTVNVQGAIKDRGKGKATVTTGASRASSPSRKQKRPMKHARVIRQSSPLSSAATRAAIPRPAPISDPARVLALYSSYYYPARILGKTGSKYSIQFDDGDTKSNVPTHHMRQLILRKGEILDASRRTGDMPASFEVTEDWDGNEQGVKCHSGKKQLGRVPLDCIAVKKTLISSTFGDRLFIDIGLQFNDVNGTIGERVAVREARASVPRSPVKQRLHGTTAASGRPRGSASPADNESGLFTKGIFLLTTGAGAGSDLKRKYTSDIEKNGGRMAKDWTDLFDNSSPGQCLFTEDLAGIPFVVPIGDSLTMTVKLMAALAKGIPCISPRYLDDSLAEHKLLDWRAYLISPGYSEHTGHYASQCVDPLWGEPGWSPRGAVPSRRPFKGKKVLFVQPSTQKYAMLKPVVPVCLYLMNVEEFKAVQNIKSNEAIMQDTRWDYVLLETREKGIPAVLRDAENVCDMHWFKQCLITGAALPPGISEIGPD